jgi:hypothetical protein
MKKVLTNEDRKTVREWLQRYAASPLYPISGKTLVRTEKWAHGELQSEIARAEGVSQVSVSQSVRTLALRVLEFAKEQE